MQQFTVTVFHGNDTIADDLEMDDLDPIYDESIVMYTASRLGSTAVSAKDEREAAARAWMEIVGEGRLENLKEWNAPATVIARERDVRTIAADLRESPLDWAIRRVVAADPRGSAPSRTTYELFNSCEVWYFCVEPVALANRGESCVGASWQPRLSQLSSQDISIWDLLIPSKN